MTDLIIFCGQSNMQGQSGALTDPDEVPSAFEYRYLSDTLIPLKNPNGENLLVDLTQGYSHEADMNSEIWRARHATGRSSEGHDNMLPAFARAYLKGRPEGTKLVAAHIAKGATVIAEWMPGTVGWRIINRKAQGAINAIKREDTLGRVFFVWLQGESDAIYKSTKEYYKAAIRIFAEGLKENLGIEKFGIIRVGRFTGDSRDDAVIEAQEEICREDESFMMLTRSAEWLCATPEYMNLAAHGHYNPRGLAILGAEAAQALAEYAGRD